MVSNNCLGFFEKSIAPPIHFHIRSIKFKATFDSVKDNILELLQSSYL